MNSRQANTTDHRTVIAAHARVRRLLRIQTLRATSTVSGPTTCRTRESNGIGNVSAPTSESVKPPGGPRGAGAFRGRRVLGCPFASPRTKVGSYPWSVPDL